MAPLQVIILLVLIRLPAILASSSQSGGAVGLLHAESFPLAWQIFLPITYVLIHAALVAVVWKRTRTALRLLNLPTISGADVTHNIDHVLTWARWGTIAIVGTYMFALPMPAIVTGWLARTLFFGKLPMLAELFYFLPPFLAWLGFWTANYQVESINRERSFPYRLAQGLPAHPMPPLSKYLSMQIRHNFYLLVLIGIASFVEYLGDKLEGRVPYAPQVATVVAFVAVLLMVPWLITRIWMTVPLRGPLRHRLDAMATQYHIRFRNILIWKTHNQVTNAAILGPVRFARYFLMTDALLEQLTDQQIESVFAHEIGHGVHRHILWYLSGMIGAMSLATGIASLAQYYSPTAVTHFAAAHLGSPDAGALILTMLMIGGFLTFGFSYVSHRFEHQADWFAARHMAKILAAKPGSLPLPAVALTEAPDPAEFDASIVDMKAAQLETMTIEQYVAGAYPHVNPNAPRPPAAALPLSAQTLPAIPPPPPEPTLPPAIAGAEVFISSLDALMEITHRSRTKRGWMHPSIDHRVNLLRQLAADPAAAAAFQQRMLKTRFLIATVILLGIAGACVAFKIPQPTAPTASQPQTQPAPASQP